MAPKVKKLNVSPYLKKVIVLLPFFFGTFLFGTLGLHFVEGKTFFESFFLTLATVSTVGYGDGMSMPGRFVIMGVILCSMTIVAYTIGAVLISSSKEKYLKHWGEENWKKPFYL